VLSSVYLLKQSYFLSLFTTLILILGFHVYQGWILYHLVPRDKLWEAKIKEVWPTLIVVFTLKIHNNCSQKCKKILLLCPIVDKIILYFPFEVYNKSYRRQKTSFSETTFDFLWKLLNLVPTKIILFFSFLLLFYHFYIYLRINLNLVFKSWFQIMCHIFLVCKGLHTWRDLKMFQK
jgi:hypothetical protein